MTKARVVEYQQAVGLPATGIADSRTQELIYTKGWPTTYATLSYGMTSPAVKTLQTKLGGLPITGYFGTLTRARVIAYQKFVGLSATGIADNRTQQLLYTRGWSTVTGAAYTAPADQQEGEIVTALATEAALSPAVSTMSTTTAFTPFKDTVLAVGSRGAGVRVLQRALGGIAVDGVFGSVTRDRVTALQRSLALPQTGVVTPDLWAALESQQFPFFQDRASVLRPGDLGPRVEAIQRLLHVKVTGVFDEQTRSAVKAAQSRAGLASTGVVASRTWSLFDRLSA